MPKTKLYPLAEEANIAIQTANPAVFSMLSARGRSIYFPKAGIVGQAADAKGKKINATAGIALEDDGTPMRLKMIADKISLEPKDVFSYSPSYGQGELRKVWQGMIRKKNPTLASPISLPVATSALTHGLTTIGYLFADPGDRIIVTDKFWGNYRLIFEHTFGAELATFNTFKNGGFDLESFRQALSDDTGTASKKKIVLLNFPNNPSGYTPSIEEAGAIVRIIEERASAGDNLIIVLDDAYFGLVFEPGVIEESLFAKLAELQPNVLAIKVDGPTKEDYSWGLRVGFLTYGVKGASEELYRALEDKTAGAVRGNISNISTLSQSLILSALTSPDYETQKRQKYELLKSRYLAIKQAIASPQYASMMSPLPCNSGYFICLKLADGISGDEVRKLLLAKYDTGVISLKDSLRLAFSSVREKDIPELVENIYQACLEIRAK